MKALFSILAFWLALPVNSAWCEGSESENDPVVKTMPYDPQGVPLSVSVEEKKKQSKQRENAVKKADEVLGPVPPTSRAPDEEDENTSH